MKNIIKTALLDEDLRFYIDGEYCADPAAIIARCETVAMQSRAPAAAISELVQLLERVGYDEHARQKFTDRTDISVLVVYSRAVEETEHVDAPLGDLAFGY